MVYSVLPSRENRVYRNPYIMFFFALGCLLKIRNYENMTNTWEEINSTEGDLVDLIVTVYEVKDKYPFYADVYDGTDTLEGYTLALMKACIRFTDCITKELCDQRIMDSIAENEEVDR